MILSNPFMDALAGETYAKQFTFRVGNTTQTVGDVGWGAEFGIIHQDEPQTQLALATVLNNKAAWYGPGVLWISFAQIETIGWKWDRAAWYLDLIMPNTSIDPNGYRQTVLRGNMRCTPRGPGRLEAAQLNFVRR